jgi:hypothetical protein
MPSDLLRIPVIPRWQLQGWQLLYRPPPEETGGVFTSTTVNFAAMSAPVGMLIATWFTLGVVIWIVGRKGNSQRWHRVRWVAVLALAGLIVAMAAAKGLRSKNSVFAHPLTNQIGSSPGPVYWDRIGFEQLPKHRNEVEALAKQPDADRVLAQEILKSAPAAAGNPESLYLAVVGDPEALLGDETSSTIVSRELPIAILSRNFYIRRPDFGESGPMAGPAGLWVGHQYGYLNVGWGSGDAARPTLIFALNLGALGTAVILLWAIGLVAWCLLGGMTVRRARQRRAKGECPRCGYPVAAS